MIDQVSRAADPAQDVKISRELLAQMDEAATRRPGGRGPLPRPTHMCISQPSPNIAVDTETAQLAASAVQAALQASAPLPAAWRIGDRFRT